MFFAVTFGAEVQGAEPAAGLLLPGDFSEHTTVADFQVRFRSENVRITRSPATQEFPAGLVLYPDDPSRRAYVAFHDEQALRGVASITVRDRDSRWRGKQGVHVGMSFAELRGANGKPFAFSGFDADLRGYVQDGWSPASDEADDALGALDTDPEDRMYFGVDLGPRPAAAFVPASSYPGDEMSVSSDDARFPRLGELFEVTAIRAYTSLDDE